jgi:peptide/nickel transport system substrate-binding protein
VKGRRILLVPVLLAAIAAIVVTAAQAGGRASTTMVFGTEADPALLDPALVQDGPSLRVTDQIFNSLVGFKLGGTTIVPELALSWKTSKNGLAWTFKLRKGVKFSDGTRFNAAAVCYNFNRWYNFPGPLQSASLAYYWQTVFGGFRSPAAGNPGPDKSLYKGCKASGQYNVTLFLTRRSSSFLAALVIPNFGIASPTALKKYQANAGTVDAQGVFHPTGTFATQHPVGTGPYMLKSWTVGSKLVLVPNPNYWGPKPHLKQVVFVPIGDTAARFQALQSGELQGMDGVDPADFGAIQSSGSFKLLRRPPFSVGYVGINQAMPPMNNPLVRQALAYGLDRKTVATAFYGGVGTPANQFLPPALFGFAKKGVQTYPFNPAKAKALLQKAGLQLPVKIDFWYPTNVSRPYMPDPARNFQAFEQSLDQSGFQVVPHSAPWRPDYRAGVLAGNDQVFLFGWIADYADPADFLNIHFGSDLPQFGMNNPALFKLLAKADAEPNYEKRVALYQQASVSVMKLLPVVPYVWAASAVAVDKNVKGYVPGPIGPMNEPFANISIG